MVQYEVTGEEYEYTGMNYAIYVTGYKSGEWLVNVNFETVLKKVQFFALFKEFPKFSAFYDSFDKTKAPLKDFAMQFVMRVSENCSLYTNDRKTYYDICKGKLVRSYSLSEAMELFERSANGD